MDRRNFGRLGMAALGHTLMAPEIFAAQTIQHVKPKLSVMLWTLGRQLSPDAAVDIASKAGYAGVELVADYKRWDSPRLSAFKTKLQQTGLVVDSMASGGQPLADPGKTADTVQAVKDSIPFAKDFGCRQFILTPGASLAGQTTEAKHQVIAETLKRISDLTSAENIEVLLEPIDRLENKDSSVTSVAEGFEIARLVARPNIKVLYDFYHEQRGTGNLLQKLEGNLDLVGLVHVADVPNRSEPGTGEINYPMLYKTLARMKYDRYIAMEFYPTGDPVTSLKQARAEVEHDYTTA